MAKFDNTINDGKIEVDRTIVTKNSSSWLPWVVGLVGLLLLLLIVLALLGVHLFGEAANQNNQTANNYNQQVTQHDSNSKVVSNNGNAYGDIAGVVGVSDKSTLDGKAVDLHHVKISTVNGSESFWVGDNEQARLFTVLDEKLDVMLDKNNTDAQQGQYVDLKGT